MGDFTVLGLEHAYSLPKTCQHFLQDRQCQEEVKDLEEEIEIINGMIASAKRREGDESPAGETRNSSEKALKEAYNKLKDLEAEKKPKIRALALIHGTVPPSMETSDLFALLTSANLEKVNGQLSTVQTQIHSKCTIMEEQCQEEMRGRLNKLFKIAKVQADIGEFKVARDMYSQIFYLASERRVGIKFWQAKALAGRGEMYERLADTQRAEEDYVAASKVLIAEAEIGSEEQKKLIITVASKAADLLVKREDSKSLEEAVKYYALAIEVATNTVIAEGDFATLVNQQVEAKEKLEVAREKEEIFRRQMILSVFSPSLSGIAFVYEAVRYQEHPLQTRVGVEVGPALCFGTRAINKNPTPLSWQIALVRLKIMSITNEIPDIVDDEMRFVKGSEVYSIDILNGSISARINRLKVFSSLLFQWYRPPVHWNTEWYDKEDRRWWWNNPAALNTEGVKGSLEVDLGYRVVDDFEIGIGVGGTAGGASSNNLFDARYVYPTTGNSSKTITSQSYTLFEGIDSVLFAGFVHPKINYAPSYIKWLKASNSLLSVGWRWAYDPITPSDNGLYQPFAMVDGEKKDLDYETMALTFGLETILNIPGGTGAGYYHSFPLHVYYEEGAPFGKNNRALRAKLSWRMSPWKREEESAVFSPEIDVDYSYSQQEWQLGPDTTLNGSQHKLLVGVSRSMSWGNW